MELRRYLLLVRQRLILILVCVLVGAAFGYAASSRAAIYRASAIIYVGSRQLANQPQTLYGPSALDQVAMTFATMIPNPVIAEAAIQATHVARNAGEVAAATTATVLSDTTLISVSVADPDPDVAQKLANGIVDAFVAKVQNYDGGAAGPGSLPSEPAYVFEPATTPTAPLPTGTSRHVVLGALFGLVVALLVVSLLEYLDITVKGADDLERRVGLSVLGIVPLSKEIDRQGKEGQRAGWSLIGTNLD